MNIQRFAMTGAIFASITMLLLSLLHMAGLYKGAAVMMQQWHMFYEPSTIVGTITGMIEAAIVTYVLILLFAWIYSLIGGKK